MAIVNVAALESNKNFKISFDGGNLSSDGGLLLMKEFMHKFGIPALLKESFHTTDRSFIRKHKDTDNLLQIIYQILGAYFSDDTADALKNDPVFTSVLEKDIENPRTPDWCGHWPKSYEESGNFDWAAEFNF